ncbi:MAG: hypothetical protein C4326_10615 [Ignavibacteria bacterium]
MLRILRGFVLLAIVIFAGCSSSGSQQAPPPIELRGVWLTEEEFATNREQMAATLQFLADHHFNAVFPIVWNGGTTLYPSKVMEEWFGKASAWGVSERDPFAELIEEARKRGIAVIPTLGSSLGPLPPTDERIARMKPNWAARDRQGRMVVRDGVEWFNPIHPEVQEFVFALLSEVVKTYDVAGVQGGDRLFAEPIEGGYDSITTALYRETHAGNEPPLDANEIHWKYWRAVRINSAAERLYWRVKAFKARMVMMWAPLIYRDALNSYLHDWRSWVNENPYGEFYADFISPLVRLTDSNSYKLLLATQHRDSMKIRQKKRYLLPGIILQEGQSRAEEEQLLEAIRYNRASGYNGEIIFPFAMLKKNGGKLAAALRRTHYSRAAQLPFAVADAGTH